MSPGQGPVLASPPRSPPAVRRRTRASPAEPDEEATRDEVKVVVRVRPPVEGGKRLAYFADETDNTKLLGAPVDVTGCASPPSSRNMSVEELSFSRVVGPQEDNRRTFDSLGLKELVAGVARGFSETVFAYGQTGSGKTHTILGSEGREAGLLQFCTREILELVFDTPPDTRRYVYLMCLEIKNEDVIDLLPEISPGEDPADASTLSPLAAGEACHKATREVISVKGRRNSYRKVAIWSYSEAMNLLRGAIASRQVAASVMNAESSRSHMIVRFVVNSFSAEGAATEGALPAAPGVGDGVAGTLTLVDLAGNEREASCDVPYVPTSCFGPGPGTPGCGGAGARKEETKAINLSLTHLNRMLVKMQHGQLDESDRRQSALNMVLYEALAEDCGVTMIFCIHPERRHAAAARSTLQMALRCRKIVQQKRVRRIGPTGYRDELADLRVEASALTHAHSQAQAAQLQKEAELRQTAQMLQELTSRYEAKSKDYEVLRTSLEAQYRRLSEEEREKQEFVADLSRKNELLQGVIQQLQRREGELSDLQRRYEEACSTRCGPTATSPRASLGQHRGSEDDSDARVRELELKRREEARDYEDRCQELEKAYRDELSAVRDSYERQLRGLQSKLQDRQKLDDGERGAAEQGVPQPKDALGIDGGFWAVASPLLSTSGGEPCSEASLRSSRAGGSSDSAFADDVEFPCKSVTQDCLESDLPVVSSCAVAKLPPSVIDTGWSVRESLRQIPSPQQKRRSQVPFGSTSTCTYSESADEVPGCSLALPRRRRAMEVESAAEEPPQDSSGSCSIAATLQKAEKAFKHLAEPWEPAAVESSLAVLCRFVLPGRLEPHLGHRCVEVAAEAMRRLPRSLRTQRDAAKLMAEILGRDTMLKDAPATRNALPFAVGTLQALPGLLYAAEGDLPRAAGALQPPGAGFDASLGSEACSACFRFLAVLCQKDKGRQDAVRASGGIDAALRCLATPALRCAPDSAVHGCWLLMALCSKNAQNQDVIRSVGGTSMLLRLLDLELGSLEHDAYQKSVDATRVVGFASATLTAYIVGCLASIAEGNVENQQALYKAGCVQLLFRTLATCLQSPMVVHNVGVAIAHVAHKHEPVKDAARQHGGVKVLVSALLAYRDHATVQGGVCRAIAVLADRNPANQTMFLTTRLPDGDADACVITLLLQALVVALEDEPLATTASWALANLVASDPHTMQEVRHQQGLETVVALLRRYVDEERACEYLCRLVVELARGGSGAACWNRRELSALGAAEVIMAIARRHALSQGFVLVRARAALQSLQDG